jgi:hypothetical protein
VPAGNRQEGLAQIVALVERFRANEPHYVSAAFDETSTRELFINGFFDALGWDVLDMTGLGAYRDVVFHPRLRDHLSLAGAEEWDEDLSEEELAAREPVAQIPDYAFSCAARGWGVRGWMKMGMMRGSPATSICSWCR